MTTTIRGRFGALAAGGALIASLLIPTSAAWATEKQASQADSDTAKWAQASPKRFHDAIRLTDRVTYTDAGRFPATACDLTGDGLTDMVFTNPTRGDLTVIPHILYGSDTDEVTKALAQQEGAITVTAPEGASGFGSSSACLPSWGSTSDEKKTRAIAVAAGNTVYVLRAPLAAGPAKPIATFTAPTTIDAVSSIVPAWSDLKTGTLAIAAGNTVYAVRYDSSSGDLTKVARTTWTSSLQGPLTLAPVGNVFQTNGENLGLAVGAPKDNRVYVLDASGLPGAIEKKGRAIQASGEGAQFGAAIAGVGDLNGDGLADIAIGAPGASGDKGAVAIVLGNERRKNGVSVALESADANPVVDQDENTAGYLLRKATRARLGSSLAWIPGVDNADDAPQPGALVVGRPIDEEHPGALVISAKALTANHNSGLGGDTIDASQLTPVASDEDPHASGGTVVGFIPRRGGDALQGFYTADIHGKVDVWTVDLSRQSDPEPDTPPEPAAPKPADPTAEPAVTPIDKQNEKLWRGDFTSGFGGSLAHGRCDVTGDGKADIISGNVTRSEWKYDPYYADSTPTKGWVHNVTGQVQIIPGGTRGDAVENLRDRVITINGPRETDDPATDASIGFSVACLGDVNGDGVDDLAVGSHTMAHVWVLFGGKSLASVDLSAGLKPGQGWDVALPADGAPAFHLARVGDVNGDGLADVGIVVANAKLAAAQAGATGSAYILSGKKNGATVDMRDIAAPNSAVIMQITTPDGHTMNSLAAVGDIDGDGTGDFVVSDFNDTADNGAVPGAAWLVYGVPAKQLEDGHTTVLSAADAADATALTMPRDLSYRLGAGDSIAAVGDVNHDGRGDLVIGFDGGTIAHTTPGGVALVLGGDRTAKLTIDPTGKTRDPRVRVITGDPAGLGTGFGWAVDALPATDAAPALLAIGAPGADGGNGRAYLVSSDAFTATPRAVTAIADAKALTSAGPKARFGRSVAFVGDYLGKPTVAFGGDGVIDETAGDGEETQGYAHSAHILALAVDRPETTTPGEKPSPEKPGETPSDTPGTGTSGDKPGEKPSPETPHAIHGAKPAATPSATKREETPQAMAERHPHALAATGIAGMTCILALGAAAVSAGSALVVRRRSN